MKFTENQKELLALLPNDLQKSKEITDAAKLIYANIILLYGTDFAKENGYVFRTNEDMMKDTEIKSKVTIVKSVHQLENKNLLQTKRGKRGEASEYILTNSNEKDLQNEKNVPKKCTNKVEKNVPIKCTNKNEKNVPINNEKCTNSFDLTKVIERLENELLILKKENEDLKNVLIKCTNKDEKNVLIKCTNEENKKCTTESESDIESESKTLSYNIYNSEDNKSKEKEKNYIKKYNLPDVTSEDLFKEKINKKENDVTSTVEVKSSSDFFNDIFSETDGTRLIGSDEEIFFNSSNENNNLKNNSKMEQQVNNRKEESISLSQKEEIIAKAMKNIDLDKSSMRNAKSKLEYECAADDLKLQLEIIKNNTSKEDYDSYRADVVDWYEKTLPFLKYADKKTETKELKPTDAEMKEIQNLMTAATKCSTLYEAEKIFMDINGWFNVYEKKYPNTIEEIMYDTANLCHTYAKTNPVFGKVWKKYI